jgi:hypothetical protein
MDINSVEFYTIAFVVAMALVGLLMGRTEKRPPSTHIVQLATTPVADVEDEEDVVCLEALDNGRVHFTRSGPSIGPEEKVNLVITIQEDRCSIVEKKGIRRRRSLGEPVRGEVTVKCLRPGVKYRMRYESQVTSAWASFAYDTSSPDPKVVKLKI